MQSCIWMITITMTIQMTNATKKVNILEHENWKIVMCHSNNFSFISNNPLNSARIWFIHLNLEFQPSRIYMRPCWNSWKPSACTIAWVERSSIMMKLSLNIENLHKAPVFLIMPVLSNILFGSFFGHSTQITY